MAGRVGRRTVAAHTVAAVALGLIAGCQNAQEPEWTLRPVDTRVPPAGADPTFWSILYADIIARSTIAPGVETDRSPGGQESRSSAKVMLVASRVYKGPLAPGSLTVHFAGPARSAAQRVVGEADGREAIVFLLKFEKFLQGALYEPTRHPPVLMTWTPALEQRILRQLSSIARFSRSVEHYLDRHVPPFERRVKTLIEQLTRPETCLSAGRSLDELGEESIPALVKHLGDMRPLAIRGFSVTPDRPDHFEGLVHHAVELIVDLLSIVLWRKTGPAGMGSTGSASSDFHRQAMVQRWQVWLGLALGRSLD